MIFGIPAVTRGLAALVLLVLVSGCASTGGSRKPASGDYATIYGQAESDVRAGRLDAALAGLGEAAKADPSRKEPWVRIAQLQFDKGNYAHAILAAEEVLQRDPDDLVADSVLAVGGFRIANQSLQRLRGNGALASNTARTEAELLVKTLRETMGEGIMRPAPEPESQPRRRSGTARRAPVAPSAKAVSLPEPERQKEQAPASSDPFKNIGQ